MGRYLIHLFPAIVICFAIQLFLHEIGHFIGGFISGWKLLYIQIYKLVIMKDQKTNKIRLLWVDEAKYECIMSPQSLLSTAKIYTIGGYLINLISSINGFILLIFLRITPVLWIYTWCFSAFGVGLFLMNGISNKKRICNDKACYDLLKSYPHTRLCHNAQLIIAKHLMNGLSYSEIDDDIICLCNENATNDIEAYQVVLEYYYCLDKGNSNIKAVLDKIRLSNNISGEVFKIVKLEYIYLHLISALKSHKYNNLNLVGIRNQIRNYSKKGNVHSMRVDATYNAFLKYKAGYVKEAVIIIERMIDTINESKFAYEGEKKFCINQLNQIKNEILLNRKDKCKKLA